jgi:thioredoxin-like negative regulator of GroEL
LAAARRINTDEEPEAVRRHGIRAIPTFAVFKNGTETARVAGAMDARSFIAWARANWPGALPTLLTSGLSNNCASQGKENW